MAETHQLADAGFHGGELVVQQRAGVGHEAGRLAGMLQPVELSGGIAGFLSRRTFLAITGRDTSGRLWTSPLVGPPGFLEARSGTEMAVHGTIPRGDPLHGIAAGQKLGLTAVEFATRRRVRVNGILTSATGEAGEHELVVKVEQAYGNCPQYIQQRHLAPGRSDPLAGEERRGAHLEADDVALIAAADTFFLGTVHPGRGADASHRGGPPGFVRVDENGLWWPDYPGNNLFNSFGNLAVNPEAALLFLDFTTGRTLHLSGTAEVVWGRPGRSGDDGRTGRLARFTLHSLVAGHLLPARETAHGGYPRNPAVTGA